MQPKKLIYTFVSYASHIESSWGHGTPVEGVNLVSAIAAQHGIPVTWIVNSGSIAVLQEHIRRRHEQYGDSVILNCPRHWYDNDTYRLKLELQQAIEREWMVLEEAFPWVRTKVAATGCMSNELMQVLESLGFEGLWGYCWEQSWWDGITHRGCPWGFWYIDSSRYKVPHPTGGQLVACEWTARDLNASHHTGNPCIYSTDPNDVLRAGLCTGTSITYWEKVFHDYLRNTDNNEQVFFVQQQEAHEMEVSDAFAVYPRADVEACAQMLDRFFAHITSFDITITNLPDAIQLYRQRSAVTVPVSMLTSDSPVRPQINAYTMTQGGVPLGPWPETFFYYDTECQMSFVRGKTAPHTLRSYVGKARMDDDFEVVALPPVITETFVKTETCIVISFAVGVSGPLPFGITYWDDLEGFRIQSAEGVLHAAIVQETLVFMRLQLTGARASVRLVLEKGRSY